MHIITGGTGMVGNSFRSLTPDAEFITKEQLHNFSYNIRDKFIIHLAAKVGGVKANTDEIADFYTENSTINQKVLDYARIGNAKKVVSLLSTCIYPDKDYVTYPLTEEQLHFGPPHQSNFGYAYAKRMVDVMSRAYRQQYGCNFITAIPNNLYGKHDNFDLKKGHVIPALIRKIWEAKISNLSSVECWGDGSALREFTYSDDVAKILLFLLENYDGSTPINIGNTEEYSIKEVVDLITEILEYDGKIVWRTDMPSGQHRKPTSNEKLINLGWDRNNYTPLKKGLQETCEWVKINYPNLRGI